MSENIVPFQAFAGRTRKAHGKWPGPKIEPELAPLQWQGDARDSLVRFKAAAEIEHKILTLWSAVEADPAQQAIKRLCDEARMRAVKDAAWAGWLTGLEVRDAAGERIRGIVGRELATHRPGLVLFYDDGEHGRVADLCTTLALGSYHLALPGSTKLYEEATIEALQARADALTSEARP